MAEIQGKAGSDDPTIELLQSLMRKSEAQRKAKKGLEQKSKGDAEPEEIDEEKKRIMDLVVKVNSQNVDSNDLNSMLEIFQNCWSCPMTNKGLSEWAIPMCKYCLLQEIGVLVDKKIDEANKVDTHEGSINNAALGFLLSSISKFTLTSISYGFELRERQKTFDEEKKEFEIRRNKRRANFYKRKEKYIEKWVMVNPKPTKKALAKELEISYEQLLRDFKELGY